MDLVHPPPADDFAQGRSKIFEYTLCPSVWKPRRRTRQEPPTAVEANARRLKTPEGRKLYALRKQTPEPAFGIIKSVMGFRQFSLRGLDNVRGEWSLVTMSWNIRRLLTLRTA